MSSMPQSSATASSRNDPQIDPLAAMPTISIDFRRIVAAFYRNRFQVAAILILCVAAAIFVTLSTTPIYRASATVQIDSQAARVVKSDAEDAPPVDYDTEMFLQTQLDVLKSRSIAQQVVDNLKLAASNEFFARMNMGAPAVPATGKTMAETRRDIIAGALAGGLEAVVPRNSRVVEIAFLSPDPAYASKIATAYAQTFIAANLQRKFDSSAYARQYLENELAKAKDRLEASDRAQTDYASRTGLIDVASNAQDGTSQSLTINTLVSANTALGEARTARITAEEKFRVAAASPLLSVADVQKSSEVQALQSARATAVSDMGRDAARYKADHPVMVQHRDQIRVIDAQITNAGQQVVRGLRGEYDAALRNEQALSGDVSGLRSGNQTEQGRRIQYNILAREAATNRAMYDAMLQRYKEVSAGAGVATSNISLIDPARLPGGPIRPRPFVNILIGLLAGMALATLFVFLRDYFDDATRTPDDIVNKLQIPFLGIVPKLPDSASANDILADPKSSVSEAFAALRTQMGLLGSKGKLGTVLVTSSRESEGKSMVIYGLARSFARTGQKVIVIDSDLRRPSQHRLFEVDRNNGLTQVLSGQADWTKVVQRPQHGQVDFIASGPLPPSVPELISSGAFKDLLAKLEAAYDLVLIDAPPVLGLADVVLLGQITDHLVYVIESNRPLRGRGLAAIRRLKSAGIRIDGAVLNKFDPKHAGYGYEYGYYYYYGHGD
jgi:polysaccharide biosynthesis transport protein